MFNISGFSVQLRPDSAFKIPRITHRHRARGPIELAECRLLADCSAGAARRRPDSRAFVQEIAGGVAT